MQFHETDDDIAHTSFEVSEVVWAGTTAAGQAVTAVRGPHFGLMLFIDGEGQSAEADEFIYHEHLVHPVMLNHAAPRRVLIVGGGEGATLREVVKYPSVEQVVMVDFDPEFVAFCRREAPSWSAGAWDDSRVTYVPEDIRSYLARGGESKVPPFDVIILDLPDAFLLYPSFLVAVREALAPGGQIVTQAGALSHLHADRLRLLRDTLEATWGTSFNLYRVYVPFFQSEWAFLASGRLDVYGAFPFGLNLRSLSPASLAAAAVLPPHLEDLA